MKNTFLALALASISSVGCAQLTPNEAIGGVIGGLAGSTIGGGNGKVVAAATGAVLGASVGRQVGQPYYGGGYPPPVPAATPRGYPPGTYPSYAYGSPQSVTVYDRPTVGCENEQYIDGVYNPPAAQAYCRGRVEREVQVQRQYENQAYERGRRGLR